MLGRALSEFHWGPRRNMLVKCYWSSTGGNAYLETWTLDPEPGNEPVYEQVIALPDRTRTWWKLW